MESFSQWMKSSCQHLHRRMVCRDVLVCTLLCKGFDCSKCTRNKNALSNSAQETPPVCRKPCAELFLGSPYCHHFLKSAVRTLHPSVYGGSLGNKSKFSAQKEAASVVASFPGVPQAPTEPRKLHLQKT